MNTYIIAIFLCLGTIRIYGDTQQSSEEALRSALNSIENLNKADLNNLRYTAAYGAKDVELSALIQLWFRGDIPPVELAWWKSPAKNVRIVIVALFLCDRTDPVEWLPDFTQDSNRFSDEERRKRLNEIHYVMSHRKDLAAALYAFLKNRSKIETLTESQQTLLNNYQYTSSQ